MQREITTPYSTVAPFFTADLPDWVPEDEQERVQSYLQYDDIYWSRPECFKLSITDEDSGAIYVPKGKTVVDTTAHYLLKGLVVRAAAGDTELQTAWDDLADREEFFSKFHTAKQSGVTRGDWIIHVSADPTKPEGSRISINTVHPAAYFPVYDDWDPDKLLKIHLAEMFERREGAMVKTYIRRLTYEYEYFANGTPRRVWRTEGFFEAKDWFDPAKAKMVRNLLKREALPEEIQTIPVYHFRNGAWQGEDYGFSELRGFERLLQAINQTITDEEVALALEGLGVYATDAAGPVDPTNNQRTSWEIAPARVMELPTGAYFKRVEGISSITPMLDHVKYLVEALYESSATTDVARGAVQAIEIAGVALAIKFQPTLAKIEQRDELGVAKLKQLMHDLKAWWNAFEGFDFAKEQKFEIELGEKLPKDVTEELNELNNMLDRGIISHQFYRMRMSQLRGYEFPDDMEQQIAEDNHKKMEQAKAMAEATAVNDPTQDPGAGKSGVAGRPKGGGKPRQASKSNNRSRPNESAGTEA